MFSFFSSKRKSKPLFFHTDMHCHIVPGVDDGSTDFETSADLVERMQSWGINRIIATPHVAAERFENTPDILDPALEDLQDELSRRGLAVDVTRSAEYRIDMLFRHLVELGTITPMPGDFLLIENSFNQEPPDLDNFLNILRDKGYRLILAHPERYLYYTRYQRGRLRELYRGGTFLQINLMSLAGYYGKEVRKAALQLIDEDMVDFIGTDLHNHHHADTIEEYLSTKDYERLSTRLRVMNDRALR